MDATAIISGLLSGLTSGAVLSAIMASLLRKRTATIEAKIKDQFDQSLTIFRSSRTWNEKSLSDLLGPLYMQFDRSKRAFGRYQGGNLFVEAKVIGEANRTIRDLLLTCPH